MKAEWTIAGPTTVTIGDDANKIATQIESLPIKIEEQVDALAFSSYVSRKARGNAQGEFVMTAAKSHASQDAAASYFQGEQARAGQTGSVVLTFASHALTMANANLIGVEVAEVKGVWWKLRYRFGITTVTYA